MVKNKIVNYFADFETSYINENQLKLPKDDRERYVFLACLKRENMNDNINAKENTWVFADGKDTLKNFMNTLITLSKTHKKNKETMRVYFHNLKYDWSYISYYLNINGITNIPQLNSMYYETIEDETALYGSNLFLTTRKNKRMVKRKYIGIDENGKKIYNEFPKYYINSEEMYLYKYDGKIEFRDSLKLYPKSVKALGKALKLPKLDEENEFSYNMVRDYNYRPDEKEIEYCVRDVDIVERFFHKAPDYSKIGITLASNSMRYFKENCFPITIRGKIYNDFDCLFPSNNNKNLSSVLGKITGKINEFKKYSLSDLNNNYKDGYTGGLTQVNKTYEGVYIINKDYSDKKQLIERLKLLNRPYIVTNGIERIIDVNSEYPYILKNAKIPFDYPMSIIDYPEEKEVIRLAHSDNTLCMCIIENVTGCLKKDKLPIIPKNRNLKRCNLSNYLYELFHHTLICNYEEFELYKEHYDIVNYEITQCVVFKCVKGVIFEDYINTFYKMKEKATEEGDKAMREIAKLFLNTLYGKFGMTPTRTNYERFYNLLENKWEIEKDREYYYYDKEGNQVFEKFSPNGNWIYPFLASCVTSYARIYLTKMIDKIPYECFLYCDTDSIHFIDNDKYGLKDMEKDGLIHKTDLGKFDNEDNTLCSVYLAPKKYGYISMKANEIIIKCAGLPDDAKEKITTIENFYYGYKTDSKLNINRCKGGIDLIHCKYEIMQKDDDKLFIYDINKNTIYI